MIRIFRHFVPVQILALVLADGLILFGSMYLGVAVRFLGGDSFGIDDIQPLHPKLATVITFTAVMLSSMAALGLYEREVTASEWGYYIRLMGSYVVGMVIMTLIFYLFPRLFLGRGSLVLTGLFSILAIVVMRGLFVRLVNGDVLKRRLLVLGTGSRAAQLEQVFRQHNIAHKFHLVGFLPMGTVNHSVGLSKILKNTGPILATAIHHKVDEIIVAVRERRQGNLPMGDLLECKLEGIGIADISSFIEREAGYVQLDSLNPSWLVFSDGFCRSSSRGLAKRFFDISVCIVFLAVTLPMLALSALLILLESGRPIFYRQVRVGECGQMFQVLKFRSMHVNAEQEGGPQWASEGDQRVTRVGRVLRKFRIDELPQILNVLRGDMSLVGPRPERPFFVNDLIKKIPYYSNRHTVRPGITGWAQIRYHAVGSIEDSRQKLQYDLYYVKNHSLFLDIVILLQTARVVLFGGGEKSKAGNMPIAGV
jgi:sugar transferase (PEP-CTERM system associated)